MGMREIWIYLLHENIKIGNLFFLDKHYIIFANFLFTDKKDKYRMRVQHKYAYCRRDTSTWWDEAFITHTPISFDGYLKLADSFHVLNRISFLFSAISRLHAKTEWGKWTCNLLTILRNCPYVSFSASNWMCDIPIWIYPCDSHQTNVSLQFQNISETKARKNNTKRL